MLGEADADGDSDDGIEVTELFVEDGIGPEFRIITVWKRRDKIFG